MSKIGVAAAAARTLALMLSEKHHLLLCTCRGAICKYQRQDSQAIVYLKE